MIVINKFKRNCYVKDDDCYIFYYLFNFKINNKNKCYFSLKKLNNILVLLKKYDLSFKINNYVFNGNKDNYNYYINLGKEKKLKYRYINDIRKYFYDVIDSKNFNNICNSVLAKIYGR